MDVLAGFLEAVIRSATPLILAAMGGLISTRVGVFNISLEGVINIGAFVGVTATFYLVNPFYGVLFAVIAGIAFSALFSYFIEVLHANETIAAIGINMLSAGLTTFLTKYLFAEGLITAEKLTSLPSLDLKIFGFSKFLDRVFNNHTVLVYVAPLVVILLAWLMYKTTFGVKFRASGDNPHALETAGFSAKKYRVVGVLATGALCGLAGVHLSLGYVTMFSEGLVAGRGYIAYTATVFGLADPFLTFLACILFAAAEALSYRSQQIGIPPQIISMLPYIVTIIALTIQTARQKSRKLSLNE